MDAALLSFIGSIIVALLSFAGVIITCINSNRKIEAQLQIAQAVMKTEVENLRKEVEVHNNFARRMPVVEEQVKDIKEDVNEIKKELSK